jgi:hypothetical protein
MPLDVDALHVAHRQRSRTHQAHFALKHIDELGQLIDAETPQKGADPRDSRIVFDFEDWTLCLIEML